MLVYTTVVKYVMQMELPKNDTLGRKCKEIVQSISDDVSQFETDSLAFKMLVLNNQRPSSPTLAPPIKCLQRPCNGDL